ncbi:preprotein translocase subunit YajC [Limibacter armeniacum]|uniref:preprotein translocase subunit YajC n=1 Tax=Limibacter armeniacum TaxID=466084 RepID=UPI002FE65C07
MLYTVLLQAGGGLANYSQILMIVAMVAIFYFFMMRPQQKKQKQQQEFSKGLKKGDSVVTVGGMHGTVAAIEGDTVLVEVDKGTKIRFEKSSISFENTKTVFGGGEKK